MRIAVFSDVQGNLPAMETVVADIRAWRPDLVIMNGDLVSRGPCSLACLELFEALRTGEGWLPIKGNHEDFLLLCEARGPRTRLDAAMRQFADWTLDQLGERVWVLRDWPDHLYFQGPGDQWVQFTHGSLAGNRLGISSTTTEEQMAQRVPDEVPLFVVAHTHKPLDREYRGQRILNVGSVGSSFDGDPRASYAHLEFRDGAWQADIRRLDYDRERAERDFHDSGFVAEGGPLARLIFEEWRQARMMMPLLNQRFGAALQAGDLDLDQAVDALLWEVRGSSAVAV